MSVITIRHKNGCQDTAQRRRHARMKRKTCTSKTQNLFATISARLGRCVHGAARRLTEVQRPSSSSRLPRTGIPNRPPSRRPPGRSPPPDHRPSGNISGSRRTIATVNCDHPRAPQRAATIANVFRDQRRIAQLAAELVEQHWDWITRVAKALNGQRGLAPFELERLRDQ
jgi:hypothetical protein